MSESTPVPRLALRWPVEAAKALGVGPAELERSDLARHIRVWTIDRVQVVPIAELERVLNSPVEKDGGT